MFRTRCLSLMYCVNLAETSHTHQSSVNACLNKTQNTMKLVFVDV